MATQKEIEKNLKQVARELKRARSKEQEVWSRAQDAMRDAHYGVGSDGTTLTFQEIADIFGLTKARIYQVVTGNRGGGVTTKKAASASANGHAKEPVSA